MRKRCAGLALAIVASTSPLHAQSVRGTLTDSITREAITGAVVILSDSAGRGLSRALSDDHGRFSISTSRATRTMRITRIGFRPRDLALGVDDSIVDVRLQPIPPLLRDVEARHDDACTEGPAGAGALDLWEQARAGLLASLTLREGAPPHIRLRRYRTTFEPQRRSITSDTAEFTDVVDSRSFVAARAPWVFADYGYLHEQRDGTREFYAPDDAVLLDPSFAATHCIHVIDGRGPRAGQVGLAFDPIATPDRDTIVDITGALWLDRTNFAPRAIEFHYTNLERGNRDSGGEVGFAVMPNGISMIDRWEIRSATIAVDERRGPPGIVQRVIPRTEQRDIRILGYRANGGQIAMAEWSDGSRFIGKFPRIEGTIHTADGAPVPNVLVWAQERRDTVRTDANGHFQFPPMAPGLYWIAASDSVLATLGIARVLVTHVVLLTNAGVDVSLKYHTRAEIFETICPRRSYRPGTGVFLARVVDLNGRPAPSARVEVETIVPGKDSSTTSSRRYGETSDGGQFVVCGAERDQRLVVRAFQGSEAGGIAVDRWGDEVLAVTIRLRPASP